MMSALRVLVHDVLDLRAEGETKRRDEKRSEDQTHRMETTV
jgi:hypothetical protein